MDVVSTNFDADIRNESQSADRLPACCKEFSVLADALWKWDFNQQQENYPGGRLEGKGAGVVVSAAVWIIFLVVGSNLIPSMDLPPR